jgi:hypothetical protein
MRHAVRNVSGNAAASGHERPTGLRNTYTAARPWLKMVPLEAGPGVICET